MKPVAIVGGGITGLTAAFRLKEQNIPCVVYEASGHAGGVIRTVRENGYVAECGPNVITEMSRTISALIRDAGLVRRRVYANPAAAGNFLLHGGRLAPAPMTPLKFLTTRMFTARGKLRVCLEPFIRPKRSREEESLADFVSRRLGPEFLEAVINPFVAGVYAGDPAQLSIRHGFPKLHAAEQLYGSLFRAEVFGEQALKRPGEISKTETKKFSFEQGLQVLPDHLVEKLEGAVQLRTAVRAIHDFGGEWGVEFAGGAASNPTRFHSAVLLAVPAHRAGQIEFHASKSRDNGLTALGEIVHPPVASVVLGFRRGDVKHPLTGFGFLVPAAEKRRILGAMFSSTVFGGRAPSGHVTITAYIGGCRNPELALKPRGEVIGMALAELREILGISGNPTFEHCSVVAHSIPQYNMGYDRFKKIMSRLETEHPGLFFGGGCKDGISLGHSIISGNDVGRRIRAYVARTAQVPAATRA